LELSVPIWDLITASTRANWKKGAEEEQQAIRLEPKVAISYSDLVAFYVHLDRFDEAKATAEKAFAQKIDSAGLHNALLRLAYIQDDQTAAQKEIQWASGRPQEYAAVSVQPVQAGYLGQRRKARELSKRAGEMARRRKLANGDSVLPFKTADGED
jgi:Flp pilus assembly protein TadD